MSSAGEIAVEVACALPARQRIVSLRVPLGTTARQALMLSDIAAEFPEVDVAGAALGIFGQVLGSKGLAPPEAYVLQPGDRVEVYRPLLADPKEVRRQRAEKVRREC
ncbi:MAG: RnfH family protein [Porticoccaceae bacterium]|jgi:putative ubiquitin-RnfH superfamily antitoxin RatB of RatAB toxin-antitoxin module